MAQDAPQHSIRADELLHFHEGSANRHPRPASTKKDKDISLHSFQALGRSLLAQRLDVFWGAYWGIVEYNGVEWSKMGYILGYNTWGYKICPLYPGYEYT